MYKIDQARDGRYFFTFESKNGKVVLTSQMYTRKSSAKKGIVSIWKSHGAHEGVMVLDITTENVDMYGILSLPGAYDTSTTNIDFEW